MSGAPFFDSCCLASCLAVAFALCGTLLSYSYSVVPEKHVGHVYRFKALTEASYLNPGLHFHKPWEQINSTWHITQTDHVNNITAFTMDGIPIRIPFVQVVNRFAEPVFVKEVIRAYGATYDRPLIFDPIQNEVSEFISRLTLQDVADRYHELNDMLMKRLEDGLIKRNVTGLIIDDVRVKQPIIPEEIKKLHISRESQRNAMLVANETRQVELIKAQTDREKAMIVSQQVKEVAVMEAEQRRQVENIELRRLEDIAKSEIMRAKEKATADAIITKLHAEAQAQANDLIHTASFMRLAEVAAWGNATKTIVYSKEEPLSFPLSVGLAAHA